MKAPILTAAQRRLLADMGPFTLTASGAVLDVNGTGMWGCNPPVMAIDRAWVAAVNHIVAEEKARQEAKREGKSRADLDGSRTCARIVPVVQG